MGGEQHPGKLRVKHTQGFTLIEVMIVMVIVGILATGVVFMFANPSANVKTQAFIMLGDLNMARSEAVTRNESVLVDFDLVGTSGYQICIDATAPANDCDGETGENFIRETIFHQKVQYYAPAALPAKGPSTTPGGGNLIGGTGIVLDDDSTITHFTLEPDGTMEDTISEAINVVVYAPKKNQAAIDGTPYAVTISASSGRVRISRWVMGGAWNTK